MSSKTIVVLFNLRPGQGVAEYEAWARATDLPTVRALPSVDRFEALRSIGLLGSDSPPPYAYVEIIEVNDMDQFGRDVGSETMKRVAGEFQRFADPLFILTDRVG